MKPTRSLLPLLTLALLAVVGVALEKCIHTGTANAGTPTVSESANPVQPVIVHSNQWKTTYGIHPETFGWIMEHNPGLPEDFMTASDTETMIFVPDGRRIPLWKMSQFLDHNFIVSFLPNSGFTAKQRVELKILTLRFRKMLAHPNTKNWLLRWRKDQGMGKYNGFRHARKRIPVSQGARTRGNTNGYRIAFGYSKTCFNMGRMGTLAHEMFHCYGNGHNGIPYGLGSGVFARGSGNRAYASYDTIDVNEMALRRLTPPPVPRMPTTFLDNCPSIAATTDIQADATALSVGGLKFDNGIGMPVGTMVRSIPDTAQRFVGLVALDDSVKNNAAASVVFELYQANGLPNLNLAQGRPVTASAAASGAFLPEYIVDGNRNTKTKQYWTAGDGMRAWLEVDLGAIEPIDAVRPRFLVLKDDRTERYQISVSNDGNDYRLVADQGGNPLSSANLDSLHEVDETEARYVRITLTYNNLKKPACLSELEVLANGTNIAKGCKTRISTRERDDFPARFAVDGKHTDGPTKEVWVADHGQEGWIEVDLGQARTIRHLRPTFLTGRNRSETYTLAVSPDGKAYDTVVDMSTNATPSTADGVLHTIPPVTARYVRLNLLGNSLKATMSLAELEVYESLTENDPRTLIARSPELSSRCQRWWCLDAPIQPGAGKNLFLVITDAGDGATGDYGAWCNAGFINR